MESQGDELGIDSFGVSVNSLEQVFLKYFIFRTFLKFFFKYVIRGHLISTHHRVGEGIDNFGQNGFDAADMAKRRALRLCDNSRSTIFKNIYPCQKYYVLKVLFDF